jgi:hypothetical protein
MAVTATSRSFQDMINDYLPNELLKEELVKRDFLLSKVEKDDGWSGQGDLIVPFKGAGASSVSFGQLTASNDIAEDTYVRGSVSKQKELWGSMIFNHRDLMEHESVSAKNFLKLLPNAVEDFMDYLKGVASSNLLNGAHFAKTTAVATGAAGAMSVDRPDRFVIGQKVMFVTTDATEVNAYVKTINMNTKVVTVVTTRGGATLVDFSALGKDLASGALIYNDGAKDNAFASLRGALLSAANGGDAALYGQTKTAYPYLQAINVSGSSITATNIMGQIFDALTTVRQFGKGNPTDIIMSYKNLGSCMKVIETSKGAFNVKPGSQQASQYGWTELEVGSVTKGGLKLIGVQEMDDDVIHVMDWRALTFHSNGFFRKRKSPDGIEYFEVRNQSGYQYIIDVCLFGELVVKRPSYCGIIHGISY